MNIIFDKEIERAIKWLFDTQNSENFGWSWVADISPNAQNTAEVVYALSLFPHKLNALQIDYMNEAVEYWLIYPSMHAFITIDWVWIILALTIYKKNWDLFNGAENNRVESNFNDYRRLQINRIDAAISQCINNILQNQNDDGGWSDYKGDISTVVRTSLVIYTLSLVPENSVISEKRERAIKWLLPLQNADGGWGNVEIGAFHKNQFKDNTSISLRTVDEQFLSTASTTGYVILALATLDRFRYRSQLKKAEECLIQLIHNDGRYDLFYEVGIKRDTVFTFRHFGTVWANLALLAMGDHSVISEEIIRSVRYLLSLQDTISGGFHCSEGSDVYTWSTCNALMLLRRVGDAMTELAGMDYLDILIDYIANKKTLN